MVRWAFPCAFCITSGGNTKEELLEHQIRRGHWIEYFAGNRRLRGREVSSLRLSAEDPQSSLRGAQAFVEINDESEVWEPFRSQSTNGSDSESEDNGLDEDES